MHSRSTVGLLPVTLRGQHCSSRAVLCWGHYEPDNWQAFTWLFLSASFLWVQLSDANANVTQATLGLQSFNPDVPIRLH